MVTDLRKAAEQALVALEQLQGGCTDSGDGTVEAITVWCPEIITALREALAAPVVKLEPLSDAEIENATGAKQGTPIFLVARGFARAIEATHNAKLSK